MEEHLIYVGKDIPENPNAGQESEILVRLSSDRADGLFKSIVQFPNGVDALITTAPRDTPSTSFRITIYPYVYNEKIPSMVSGQEIPLFRPMNTD